MSNTQSISFRPQTPSVTLSQLTDAFKDAASTQHLRFGKETGLHTHSRFAASSVDFKAFFGNREALNQRAELRSNATQQVRQAIDNQYGKGMADRVFARADESGNNFAGGITKSDLSRISNEARLLSQGDSQNATKLLGGTNLGAVFSEVVGDIPNKQDKFGEVEAKMATAVHEASVKGVMVPDANDLSGKTMKRIDATPEQLKRVAIGVIIKHEVVETLRETKPKREEEMIKASKTPLNAGEIEKRLASSQLKQADIDKLHSTVDGFTAPGGAMADTDLKLVRELFIGVAETGNQQLVTTEVIAKKHDVEALMKLPTDKKLEKIEAYVEHLLHPDEPLVKGEVASFGRSNAKDRTDPGYAELMLLREEVNDNFKDGIDKVQNRLKTTTSFEVLGEKLAPLTQEELNQCMTPNMPKRPQIEDTETKKMRDKTDPEMSEIEKQDHAQVMEKYERGVETAQAKQKELQLARIMITPAARDVPMKTMEVFDKALGELLGGFGDEALQKKADSLPESFCRMFAVAHQTIDEKATFSFDPQQLQTKTEGKLIEEGKADLKKKIDVNFMALRVLSPMFTDRASADPKVANNMKSFSVMLQGVMNGITPLNKGKVAHHPEVVEASKLNMTKWQGAMDTLAQKIVERGMMLNEAAKL